jgi:hypothetical protein
LVVFVWRYAVYGGKPSNVVASVIGFNDHATDALPTSTYQDPEMHILILRIASRHVPKAGAACGNSARTDLGGGPNRSIELALDRHDQALQAAARQKRYHLFPAHENV